MTDAEETTIDPSHIKRTLAAGSVEGARILGSGVSKVCFQSRYNAAARAALADPEASFTPEERRLIASLIIEENDANSRMAFTLRVRLSGIEREKLERRAQAAELSMSEYVREKIFPTG